MSENLTRLRLDARRMRRRGEVRGWCQYFLELLFDRDRIRKPPIFIVGCGHSGTSLMLAALGMHSEIFAVPWETSFARRDDVTFRCGLKMFERFAVAAGKARWVEKTPLHLWQMEKLLSVSDSRIIMMVRDARDVACSIAQRTGSLERGVNRWVLDNMEGRKYWEHSRVWVLRYEDLINDFAESMSRVLCFLGEEYEDSIADFHAVPRRFYSEVIGKPDDANGGNHEQYRNWQINQPIFDGRGRYIKELSSLDLNRVMEVAGPLLFELGYV